MYDHDFSLSKKYWNTHFALTEEQQHLLRFVLGEGANEHVVTPSLPLTLLQNSKPLESQH
jgi:hypothetical protein